MVLIPCRKCGGRFHPSEGRCPFCGAPAGSRISSPTRTVVLAILAGVVLYGGVAFYAWSDRRAEQRRESVSSQTAESGRSVYSRVYERPPMEEVEREELPFPAEAARVSVRDHIRSNKLGVTANDVLRVKTNPAGRGVFVYHPKTRFYGVERLIVWWVPEPGQVFPLNSPSKMVTPDLPWPREAGVEAPRTYSVVDYVFRGRPMGSR